MDQIAKCVFAFEILEKHPYAVRADRTVHQGPDSSSWHKHDFVQVWYCHQGSYTHQIGDETFECGTGSVTVIPLGTPHQFWVQESADLMRLSIHINLLDPSTAANYIHSTIGLFLPAFFRELKLERNCYCELSPESQALWEQIFSWFAMLNYLPGDPYPADTIRQKMEQLFSVPEFAVSERVKERSLRLVQTRIVPIFRIVTYLNKHYAEKLTDEILQQEGNLSRAVMYRHFKHIMKDTYVTFLQHLRARHAHICMRETIYSLSDIAELCGFYDVYYMSRVYAKCTGMTIGKHRMRLEQCRKARQEDVE